MRTETRRLERLFGQRRYGFLDLNGVQLSAPLRPFVFLSSNASILLHIFAHELTEHLCGGLVLLFASREKLLAQLFLYSYAKANIFHAVSVPNGYTFG